MIAVVTGVALFMTISQADEKCKGGKINQHLCQKTCNLTSCSCDMTDTSPFTSCAQKCHFFSSCPKMICSGKRDTFKIAGSMVFSRNSAEVTKLHRPYLAFFSIRPRPNHVHPFAFAMADSS